MELLIGNFVACRVISRNWRLKCLCYLMEVDYNNQDDDNDNDDNPMDFMPQIQCKMLLCLKDRNVKQENYCVH